MDGRCFPDAVKSVPCPLHSDRIVPMVTVKTMEVIEDFIFQMDDRLFEWVRFPIVSNGRCVTGPECERGWFDDSVRRKVRLSARVRAVMSWEMVGRRSEEMRGDGVGRKERTCDGYYKSNVSGHPFFVGWQRKKLYTVNKIWRVYILVIIMDPPISRS